jgi:hypothetical protein
MSINSMCALDRNTYRKEYSQLCCSEQDNSPIMSEPLNKEQLKSLLDLILEAVSELPESNDKNDYAL